MYMCMFGLMSRRTKPFRDTGGAKAFRDTGGAKARSINRKSCLVTVTVAT